MNPTLHTPSGSLAEAWRAALDRMAQAVSAQNYAMWLQPIEMVQADDAPTGATVVVRVPNPFHRIWFENHYLAAICVQLAELHGRPVHVEIAPEPAQPAGPPVPPEPAPQAAEPPAAAPASAAPSAAAEPAVEPDTLPPEQASLNPRYTFDTFVSGPSNQLAFAASQGAAGTYPPKFNPLFLCGGVGLGKTHLLHAIGHTQIALRPGTRVVYLSAERFMNEYINALRSGRIQQFRARYREHVDVLLIDDVQFLAGKDGTQEEFFHTFNALHDGHKQIVLTADRKPHEISDIADRLRSRFAWGLMADIEPPGLEVRIAILRKKAATENIHLPDDVATFIASSIKSNVRELEGALIRLGAYASLLHRPIDLAFAQESLGNALTRPREHITVEGVIKAVSHYYGTKPADIKSPRRHKSIAGPRAVAMYLARQHTKDSYPDLGRAFGNKHHTTIISAVEKIAERLKDDPALRGEIHAIEAQLLR